MNDAVLDILCE